jgi:hypothetical protein
VTEEDISLSSAPGDLVIDTSNDSQQFKTSFTDTQTSMEKITTQSKDNSDIKETEINSLV